MSKIYEALKRAEQERELRADSAPLPRLDEPLEGSAAGSAAEAYRRLAATLVFSGSSGRIRSLVFTAARHGEGVTETVLGVGAALVREGRDRVAILEANVRRPAMRQRLHLGVCPGLSDYLRGATTVAELVRHVPGLDFHVVLAGTSLPHLDYKPAEVLLEELLSRFDLVLVDAPPANEYADAAVLSAGTDGAVLVIEAERTTLAEVEAAKRSLEKAGARVLGAVLNRSRAYVPRALRALF